jgi:uncharacterized protein (TIGR03083 family)
MPTRDQFLGTFRRDADLFEAALRNGDLDAEVDGCPGWSVSGLVEHIGTLHRYVTEAIVTAAKPGGWPAGPEGDLADWFAEGAAALEAAMRERSDDEACYTFFDNAPKTVGTWVRRQCQELAVHRYDAELAATGTAEAIDAEIAKDGIEEYFDLFVPRVDGRSPIRIGELSVHLHATDVDGGEWFVRCGDHAPAVTREHAKGDVAVNGPADQILLALWGRIEPGDMDLELYGDIADWQRFQSAASI